VGGKKRPPPVLVRRVEGRMQPDERDDEIRDEDIVAQYQDIPEALGELSRVYQATRREDEQEEQRQVSSDDE